MTEDKDNSQNEEFKIYLGKSITQINFEKALNKNYQKSILEQHIFFDLKEIEWISLFDFLLLLQWINKLSKLDKNIKIACPSPNFLLGIDDSGVGVLVDEPIKKPMRRRSRVLEFLFRIGGINEFKRIIKNSQNDCELIIDRHSEDFEFSDDLDPYEAKILKISSFWDKEDLEVEKELSNIKLRNLLKKYSCLDVVDSGMLSNVVIEELASNAIKHGIDNVKNSFNCAWVTARLIKTSTSTLLEQSSYYKPAYKSLMGKHYVELSICDNGPGIHNKLKDFVPQWIYKNGITAVKATINYAFDKYSSSGSEFRTEFESLPRGLFYVFDLIRQYRGLLTVRSNGYYMAYDFLTRNKHPRLLGLYNNGGKCIDVDGTAIQIILPQSDSVSLSTTFSGMKNNLKDPIVYEVEVPEKNRKDINELKKIIPREIEGLCHGTGDIPIIIDFSAFDLDVIEHWYLYIYIFKYIIIFQNPNLLWVYSPYKKGILDEINNSLLFNQNKIEKLENEIQEIDQELSELGKYSVPVTPIILQNAQIKWLGATKKESDYLNSIWGSGIYELSRFDEHEKEVTELANRNPHLLTVNTDRNSNEYTIAFNLGIYDVENTFLKLLKETSLSLCHRTENVINQSGCYHLPHGEYSDFYVYLKPILRNEFQTLKLARYLITNLFLNHKSFNFNEIEMVIGGTHSAKRLIRTIGKELRSPTLTIDRYLGQIRETIIGEKVAQKNTLIVSDVISSGTFISEIAKRMEEEGANIIAVLCICDLRNDSIKKSFDATLPVYSLIDYPIKRHNAPTRQPIYEVNPISLRPTIPEKEAKRNIVNSLLSPDKFVDWVNKSKSLIPGHLVLGPTHYTYFIDTKTLLYNFSEEIRDIVLNDFRKTVAKYKYNIENDFRCLFTAEDSNAELFFPELVKKEYPLVEWVQIERIRLSVEGTWQLDRLDPEMDPIENIKDKVVIIWDDGSNTGGTLIQMLEIVSEFKPKLILAYCLINRLSANRSRFYSRLQNITDGNRTIVRFLANVPVSTFVHSNCPICTMNEPRVPTITELENYRKELLALNTISRWNHIAADTISEKARKTIIERGYNDVESFLSTVFSIRAQFGYFENHVNISKEIREKLGEVFENEKNLAALCYILNREPQLSFSIMNFQIRDFEKLVITKINNIVLQEKNIITYGAEDILEYIIRRDPSIVLKNYEVYFDKLINNHRRIIVFIYNLLRINKFTFIDKYFEDLLNTVKKEKIDIDDYAYLKGVVNTCLSWIKLEKSVQHNDDLKKYVIDLQTFYQIGKPHGEAGEYGRPLSQILNYVYYYQKSKKVRRRDFFDSIYRDWRDYTVKCIEERLGKAYKVLSGIFAVELSSTMQNYYNVNRKYSYKYDYLRLQKIVSELKEARLQEVSLKANIDELIRSSNRIAEYLFNETKAPVAKFLKKIPVFINKHIRQRLANNRPWIELAEIKVVEKLSRTEIECFMTSRLFKLILDRIFLNIKMHNFGLIRDLAEEKKKLNDPKILIETNSTDEKVVLLIKSNGPLQYNKGLGHGIRISKDSVSAYGAKLDIYNKDGWVVNKLEMKRW